jgi:hypothetical protein
MNFWKLLLGWMVLDGLDKIDRDIQNLQRTANQVYVDKMLVNVVPESDLVRRARDLMERDRSGK